MFDHFYEVNSDSTLFNDYFKWLTDYEKMRNGVVAFKKEYDIAGDTFMIDEGKLWVDISLNRQFSDQFGKVECQGHSPFKKTSSIGKAFTKANIKEARKPFVPFYFKNPVGRSQIRLFDQDGKLYVQYSTEYEVEDTPKGFIPIKASEFYKVMEQED